MSVSADTLRRLAALNLEPAKMAEVLTILADSVTSDKERSAGAIRQARYRERKAASVTRDVTRDVTDDITAAEKKENSPTPPIRKTTSLTNVRDNSSARDAFDRVRKAYPRRQGRDPNDTARKSLAKALAAGATIDEIEAGALAFAKFRASDDARFTPMLATWLNQRGWMDDYTGPPPRDGPAPKISNLAKLAMGTFFDDGNSTHHATPAEPVDRRNVVNVGDVPDSPGAGPRLLGHSRASGSGWR
jgi:hypothetical protein